MPLLRSEDGYEDQYERYSKHNPYVGAEMQPMGLGWALLIVACTVGPFILWGLIS